MHSPSISCILTVYRKTNLSDLLECLQSIYAQKLVLPSELIVVFDGADSFFLLESLLDPPEGVVLKTLFLPRNLGPGQARHIAILSSTCRYVAIMDSDDICADLRFYYHYSAFSSGCDFSAGQLALLSHGSTNVIRKSSFNLRDFLSYVRYRTPFNNQTLAFSRHLYLLSGGYPSLRIAEDWVLMARIFPLAVRPHISPNIFVFFREDSGYSSRRTTLSHSLCEFKASCYVCLLGLSRPYWPILVLSTRILARNILPSKFLKIFESFFRSSV